MRSVARNLWWFVIPALAFYVFIVVAPTIQGVGMSMTNWSAFSLQRKFIGLDNYADALGGASGGAVMRTLVIAGATMIIQNVVGLLLALALNGRVLGRNVLRTLIFAPVVVSPLVCGFLFKYIFGPQGIGAANMLLESIGLGHLQHDWLGDPNTALTIVIIVIAWQFIGVSMVIYLAGLQGVPSELLEAAALDGAGAVQRFWHVVRPLLAPAFTINLMLSLIGGLKIFDQIFATTQGGPAGTTETISTLIYKQFSLLGEYGLSAALAVVLAIAVAILSIIQFSILRKQESAS
ncbi:carbohydrate ABC transporter permease [Arthrobacter sp. SA17]